MSMDILDLDENVLVTIPSNTVTGFAFDNIPLRRANLAGMDLTGSTFQNCDLTGADLTNADLSDGDLSGAILNRTEMAGCNLSNCLLSDTGFMHVVSFKNATDIGDANVGGACHFDRVTLKYCLPSLSDAFMVACGYPQGEVDSYREIYPAP